MALTTTLITGGRGYVGSILTEACTELGHEVYQLARTVQGSDPRTVRFSLTDIPSKLPQSETLIHCAYDFAPLDWEAIFRVNVEGSKRLFDVAQNAGVKRIVFISSVAAYEGCHSLYGRAKLLVEEEARKRGGVIIRPGLVYGERPGGMVGKLNKIAGLKALPIVGGQVKMFLCHDQDLKELLKKVLCAEFDQIRGQIFTAASENGLAFAEIIRKLARVKGNSPLLIPIPWRAAWLGLKFLEIVGKPIGFKSDSLVSLMTPNPSIDFRSLQVYGAPQNPDS